MMEANDPVEINCMRPTIYQSSATEKILASLHTDGYAVVSIATMNNHELRRQFLDDLTDITGRSARDDQLFTSNVDYPQPKMPGLLGEYGLSQGNAAWSVRCNQEIQQVFAGILGVNSVDLVCSADAMGYSPDHERPTWARWLHVDQNPYIEGGKLDSYQGIYYAEDSFDHSPLQAATIIVPGSHHKWKEHTFTVPHHFQSVDQDKYWPEAVKLEIPAGCLLVYTSRLIHQGWHGPHRLCFMVSYGRKKDRTEEIRRTKVMMYLGGHRSTHWSQFAHYHGEKWRYGEHWHMLEPRYNLEHIDTVDPDLLESFLEDKVTSVTDYTPALDAIIPPERLILL